MRKATTDNHAKVESIRYKSYPPSKISPFHLLRGRYLQHRLGSLFSLGSAVAVSLLRLTTPEPSADFRLPGHGRWTLRDHLFRSGTCSGAGLVTGRCRVDGKSAWPYRALAADLEWCVAAGDDRPVAHERSYLVDPLCTVPP